jgi:hypothetical protein
MWCVKAGSSTADLKNVQCLKAGSSTADLKNAVREGRLFNDGLEGCAVSEDRFFDVKWKSAPSGRFRPKIDGL